MNFYEGKLELTTGLPYVLDRGEGVYYRTSYDYDSERGGAITTKSFNIAAPTRIECRSSYEYAIPSWSAPAIQRNTEEQLFAVINIKGFSKINTSLGYYDTAGGFTYLTSHASIGVMNSNGIMTARKIFMPGDAPPRITLQSDDAYLFLYINCHCDSQIPHAEREMRFTSMSVTLIK